MTKPTRSQETRAHRLREVARDLAAAAERGQSVGASLRMLLPGERIAYRSAAHLLNREAARVLKTEALRER
jgi:hypothetical protein